MKNIFRLFLLFFSVYFLALPVLLRGEEVDYEGLMRERVRSVVAVEFFVETEIDRRPTGELGIVADDNGLIVMQEDAIPGWIPPSQLKEFMVFTLGGREEYSARYLGQDRLTGWHFLRVEDAGFLESVTPVTSYEVGVPRVGQEVWGFGVMDKEFDFEPYFSVSRFSLLRDLPRDIGFTVTEVSSPGALVFASNGDWLGWSTSSYLREGLLHVGDERIPMALQGTRESGAFLPVSEVLPYLDRVPESPDSVERVWIGVIGMQSVERELAKFLKITDGSGVVLSEVVEGSPAAEADIQRGDVVVAVDGVPIPDYRPRQSSPEYIQLQILRRSPGDKVSFTLWRGSEKLEREVTIGVQPPTVREARREYLSKLGLTVREFLLFDGMARRVGPEPERGLVVHFVRPNGPAATAGLGIGDWIQEVDGVPVSTYVEAVERMQAAESSEDRREVVLLVNRQNETSVMRIRMQ